ncbi:MAG: hypothetical protein LC745_00200 [Planctomycetia bacterium]|nr:hypothetical protein [Planctomycetia bacterium]
MRRKRSPVVERLEDRLCMDAGNVPAMYLGSPLALPTNGVWTQTAFYGSPIFADLKGDGHQEMIVEAAGGRMLAYGTDARGQLYLFQTYQSSPKPNGVQSNFKSTPVVVNVPGVGTVLVGALGRNDGNTRSVEDGRVYAFNAVTGAVLWVQDTNYPPPDLNAEVGVTGALTVGYLEGNGMPDVIVNSFSSLVKAFRVSDGSKLWQFENDDTVEPGAVVADLYGDGKQEVIYNSGITPNHYYPNYFGFITILNADGSLLRRIPIGESFFASPIVADLFGDGRKEIVAAPIGYFNAPEMNYNPTPAMMAAAQSAGNRVYAFFPDGTPVPGWPYHTTAVDTQNHQSYKEPVAADLYGNGQSEVMLIDRLGVLHVILPNGQDAPGFEGGKVIDPGGKENLSSPIVADINGDGRQDIVVGARHVFAAYDNAGNLLFSTFAPSAPGAVAPNHVYNAAAYGQFDPNGSPVLAYASADGAAPGEPQFVTIFSLPRSPVPAAWPMLRRNSLGQAVLPSYKAEAAFAAGAIKALFLRDPTNDEVSFYVPYLTSNALTHLDLAAKLAKSPEGLKNLGGALNVSDADTLRKVSAIYRMLGVALQPDSQAAIVYDAHRGRTLVDAAILIVSTGGNYAAASAIGSWARSIYRDVFGFPPDPNTTAGFIRANDSGASPRDIAKGLLLSTDARKAYLSSQIVKYLGRPLRASDLGLLNLRSREDVVTAIVSGPEFFARHGNNVAAYVNAAYQTIAGYTPSSTFAASWVQRISQGTASRATLARALVTSPIYYNQFVLDSLFKYVPDASKGVLRIQLGSPPTPLTNPDPKTVSLYTNQLLNHSATQEDVLATLMASPQYFSNSTYFRGLYISPSVRL